MNFVRIQHGKFVKFGKGVLKDISPNQAAFCQKFKKKVSRKMIFGGILEKNMELIMTKSRVTRRK